MMALNDATPLVVLLVKVGVVLVTSEIVHEAGAASGMIASGGPAMVHHCVGS